MRNASLRRNRSSERMRSWCMSRNWNKTLKEAALRHEQHAGGGWNERPDGVRTFKGRRRSWRSEGTAPLCERSDDCGKRNVFYGVQFRSVDCVSWRSLYLYSKYRHIGWILGSFKGKSTSRGAQLTSLGQMYKVLRLLEITRDSFKVEWKLVDVRITKEEELSLYSKFFGGTSICPRPLGC